MPGFLITIEGSEGAGKTTLVSSIKEYFESKNRKCITLREPGGSLISEKIRSILKESTQEKMHDLTELLLMYASRVQLVKSIIEPNLLNGVDVICDRFDLSTIAYQGYGRGIDLNIINSIRALSIGDLKPDVTLLLDVNVELGMQRVKSRGKIDRFEELDLKFFENVRKGFLDNLNKSAKYTKVIDASLPIDDVRTISLNFIEKSLYDCSMA